jgi:Asp-tRNA(Asn)/Glu-tRNA(Gln) amidotransferase A subunit family amidase
MSLKMSLIKLNATKAIEMMKKGELSSEKYVSAFLEHIEKREPACWCLELSRT